MPYNNRRRLVLISEIFYPNETSTAHILTKISNYLAKDFEILVITASKPFKADPLKDKNFLISEKNIIRVRDPKLSKNNLVARSIRLCILSFKLSWETLRNTRNGDIVLTVTNPAPLIVIIAFLRSFLKFRLILLVHDVFPENAVATGVLRYKSLVYKIVKRVFDRAYSAADILVSIGRDMTETIETKLLHNHNQIFLIENWADEFSQETPTREESLIGQLELTNKVVIQYAGNIGRAQGCIEFLDTISVIENPNLMYVFRGGGAMFEVLSEKSKHINSVLVEGPFARSDENKILSGCDIGIVILHPQMYGLGVPSKAYNILANKKPILFLGPKNSEIYRLVSENKVGWAFDWNELDLLSSFLSELSVSDLNSIRIRGEAGGRLVRRKYSEQSQLQKFKNLVNVV